MKKFEFRLSRVLDYRLEEAGVERTRLGSLLHQEKEIEDEECFLQGQLTEARDEAMSDGILSGAILQTLAEFKRYVGDRMINLEIKKTELQSRIREQRLRVLEAERRVNLLLKLKARKLDAWTEAQARELEALAADSFMAKLALARQKAQRKENPS
jgi:hypothetical protein